MMYILSIAAICGVIAVYLILPHRGSMAKLGGLIGAAALGLTLAWLGQQAGADRPNVYYYMFTAIAVAAGIRVITHPRPVYAALYFVLVVLSTAGMLVILEAEFMAFAMIIIYAGAILITYMFVIMLATLPQSSQEPDTSPVYDRSARQPLGAVVMGFALLTLVAGIIFDPHAAVKPRYAEQPLTALKDLARRANVDDATHRKRITRALYDLELIRFEEEVYDVDLSGRRIDVRVGPGARPRYIPLDDERIGPQVLARIVPNIDHVGLNLFKGHTLGIELAAVILLLAMVGAIVIAKRMVPEGEPKTT
jgi:NADH-quinone oxidoreductase subunit J